MKTLAVRTIKFSLILLALLVVLLLAAPFFIHVGDYKSILIDKAEQATGRQVDIGEVHVSLFPWVGVRLQRVRIANPQGFPDPDMLHIKELNVQIALLPLLRRHIKIDRFVLSAPELWLERDPSGVDNWRDLIRPRPPAPPAAGAANAERGVQPPPVAAAPVPLSARDLLVEDGILHYRDLQTGRGLEVRALHIDVEDVQLERPVHVHARGRVGTGEWTIDAEVGPPESTRKILLKRLPIQAGLKVEAVPVQELADFVPALNPLVGNVLDADMHFEQRPGGLRLSTGKVELRGGHVWSYAWKFEMPKPRNLDLQQSELRLDGVKVGSLSGSVRGIGRTLRYQLRMNTEEISRQTLAGWWPRIERLYAAHPSPWKRLRLGFLASGDLRHLRLQDVRLLMDHEPVMASGDIGLENGPDIRLRINATSLHLDPWLPRPGPPAPAASTTGVPATAPPQPQPSLQQPQARSAGAGLAGARIPAPTGHAVPVEQGSGVAADRVPVSNAVEAEAMEPDLRFLKRLRLTASVTVDHLFLHQLDLTRLRADIGGKRGLIRLNPLHFEVAGGLVDERASLTVSRYPVRWTESVHIRGMHLRPVLVALTGLDTVSGVARIDTRLHSRGLLARTALKHLNGRGKAQVLNGAIKGFDIPGILRNLSLFGRRNSPGQTEFSELSGTFSIRNGVVRNDDLFMTSPLFQLTGYGRINLPSRNMDFHIKPRLLGALAGQGDTERVRKGLVVPLRIVGPVDRPRVRVEMDLKTLLGNVHSIKNMLKGKGGLKGVLNDVLGGSKGGGQSAPPPAANPIERLQKRFKELLPGF